MRAAVTCLGHRHRGDDAAGMLVADRLAAAGVPLLDCGEDPSRLLDHLAGLDLLVVVDAVRSGAPPGTLHRIVLGEGDESARTLGLASTHALSIVDALALARALGRAPGETVVHGIEGAAFGLGEPLTTAVAEGLDELTRRVIEGVSAERPVVVPGRAG